MKKLIELLETLEEMGDIKDDCQRLKYDTAFYVQEKPTAEFLDSFGGGGYSTVILPNARISTKKVIEAILEHLELKMDYTTGKNPDVILRKSDG